MSAWKGMNVAQVQKEGRDLDRIAGELKRISGELDKEVREIDTNWNGEDSKKFVQEWEGEHKGKIEAAIRLLQDMSEKVERNARGQQDTSNA
ncbi:hypothetical protein GCM10022199_01760 [Marihabitans asiaticum]|uniref:WXG100 family type VII secretion target n=1 Tax=Marihabitans asiaticum TaxID=415218 RepID=A0A560WG12_9MICO|nr:WXG100 family type VII secretion target [Marihabitans asiaticum]TWD16548.1 WXG100 family type VII secretion target [Marihabitans asiaticum]